VCSHLPILLITHLRICGSVFAFAHFADYAFAHYFSVSAFAHFADYAFAHLQ
jgi:hypothetical protein